MWHRGGRNAARGARWVAFGLVGALVLLAIDAFNGVWYGILLGGLILFELLAGKRSGARP